MPLRRLSPVIEQPAALELITEDDPLARELANVDALPEQGTMRICVAVPSLG